MNNEELAARYSEIQDSLAAAPNWKVGTQWWNDRIAALQAIKARLGW